MQNDLLTRTAETRRTVQAWATRLTDQVPAVGATADEREKVEALVGRIRTETEQVLKGLPGADQVEKLIADVQGRMPATRAEVADLEARIAKAETAAKKPAAKKAATPKAAPKKAATAKKATAAS